jgi:HSP20 family molecular chaperone IbpA
MSSYQDPIYAMFKTFLDYHISHNRSSEQRCAPNFDVRETSDTYYLEGEFPGVVKKSDITLHWLDTHTLVIEAWVTEANPYRNWSDFTTQANIQALEGRSSTQGRIVEIDSITGEEQWGVSSSEMTNWLGERKIGKFQRLFSFPHEIDIENTSARLEDGLLYMRVPKLDIKTVKHRTAEIENFRQSDSQKWRVQWGFVRECGCSSVIIVLILIFN